MKATAGNEAALEDALKANWNEVYTDWQIDKERIALEQAAGHGVPNDLHYSNEYLADRAAMLTWVIKLTPKIARPRSEIPIPVSAPVIQGWVRSTSISKTMRPEEIFLGSMYHQDKHRYILFGSDDQTCEALTGYDEEDHLYGGAGSDILDGGKGNDYLEGGRDNDTLKGGIGNDILKGGDGLDTYVFTSGDGWDTITDSDGLGKIEYDGVRLAGGEYVLPTFGSRLTKPQERPSLSVFTKKLKAMRPLKSSLHSGAERRHVGQGLATWKPWNYLAECSSHKYPAELTTDRAIVGRFRHARYRSGSTGHPGWTRQSW